MISSDKVIRAFLNFSTSNRTFFTSTILNTIPDHYYSRTIYVAVKGE
jgi:hypothetical protein